MQRQQAISARRLKRKVGTRQQVIIDEACTRDGHRSRVYPRWATLAQVGNSRLAWPDPGVGATVAKGRSRGDAPDIDGSVYVASRRPLRVGEIATVRIERADEYDLHGTVVGF
jgi:ribosomal protein S12 methylthiotransferase